jgi:hypothetical protein
MLNVNPKMIGRLNELEADLLARRERAHAEGWSGEIEGIDLTLSLLRAKRDATARLVRKSVVDLGIPTPRSSPRRRRRSGRRHSHTPPAPHLRGDGRGAGLPDDHPGSGPQRPLGCVLDVG